MVTRQGELPAKRSDHTATHAKSFLCFVLPHHPSLRFANGHEDEVSSLFRSCVGFPTSAPTKERASAHAAKSAYTARKGQVLRRSLISDSSIIIKVNACIAQMGRPYSLSSQVKNALTLRAARPRSSCEKPSQRRQGFRHDPYALLPARPWLSFGLWVPAQPWLSGQPSRPPLAGTVTAAS